MHAARSRALTELSARDAVTSLGLQLIMGVANAVLSGRGQCRSTG